MHNIPASAATDLAYLFADMMAILNRRFALNEATPHVEKFEALCERHKIHLASADTMRAVRQRAAEYDAAKRDSYRSFISKLGG